MRYFATLARLSAVLALALIVFACARQTSYDFDTVVRVTVENESDRPVRVEAVRSAAHIDFAETVAPRSNRKFLVRHAAFGDGPVSFQVVSGYSRLRRRYLPREKLRVPEGAYVLITVRQELRTSTVHVIGSDSVASDSAAGSR